MKRMYSLDFIKLIFAYVIAFFHFGTQVPPGPTVTVQIFFLFSGFFLGKKFYSRRDSGYGPWDYTVDHVKSLYPMYLFGLVMFFLYLLARAVVEFVRLPSLAQVEAIALSFYNQIPDLLLLQSAYNFHDSYNYPLWQISALVIAGYFVYALLCRDEKLSRTILFPAAVFMALSLLKTGVDIWGNYGPIYIPLLRAFAPMCLGVLAFYFTTTEGYARLRQHKLVFDAAVWLALAGIFLWGDHANIFLVTTPLILWGCAAEESSINRVLNKPIFRRCGELSYSVYVNHALIARFLQARVLSRVAMAGWMQNLLYFAVLTVYSVGAMYLVAWWKARRKEKAVQ